MKEPARAQLQTLLPLYLPAVPSPSPPLQTHKYYTSLVSVNYISSNTSRSNTTELVLIYTQVVLILVALIIIDERATNIRTRGV